MILRWRRKTKYKPQDSKYERLQRLKNIFLGSFIMLIVASVIIAYFLFIEIPKQKTGAIDDYVNENELKGRVMVLTQDLLPEETIEGKYEYIEIDLKVIPTSALSKKGEKRVSMTKLSKNTVLTDDNTILLDNLISDDLRRVDLKGIEYPTGLKVGDFVDVLYFDGQSEYLVLSKKEVLMINSGTIWFNLNQREDTLFREAILNKRTENSTRRHILIRLTRRQHK